MINREDEFITLHTGRPPLIEHFAWVLALFVTVVGVWNLPANGQTIPATDLTATGGCSLGATAFTSNEEHCRKAGGVFTPRTYMTITQPMLTATGSSSGVYVSSHTPKCDDGWSLVLGSGNRPMCARELREPK